MQREELMQVIAQSFDVRDIPVTALPEIELYMDQIITLFEQHLAGSKRSSEEKLITKTMINNYSKEGLLERIKGKKYSREHILMMLIIYNLKQTLSIGDISRLIYNLNGEIVQSPGVYNKAKTAEIYSGMLALKQTEQQKLSEFLAEIMQNVTDTNVQDPQLAAMTVIALTQMSNLCKRAAEAVIDQQLPPKIKVKVKSKSK